MLTHLRKQYFTVKRHSKICVIGGGAGAMNLVGQLRKYKGIQDPDITVFEPKKYHYYQPGWTMVAAGIFQAKETRRPTRDMFSSNINVITSEIVRVDPDNSELFAESGEHWSYDHLIISTGINTDFTKIKGAQEALDDPNSAVGSSYHYDYAQKMSKIIKEFKGGKFLFTEPQYPIKGGATSQTILFLAEEVMRKNNIRSKCDLEFHCQKAITFGVKKYSDILDQIHKDKNVQVNHNSLLVEIKKDEKIAVFESQLTKQQHQIKYDAMHIIPPQYPPKFIKESKLGNEAGFVDVNDQTLQHKEYNHKPISAYDGYTSCPILVGDNKLLLTEFKYGGIIDETFMVDQKTPRNLFYRIKKDFFPWAYWNLVPKGFWYGRKGIIPAITIGMKSKKVLRWESDKKPPM